MDSVYNHRPCISLWWDVIRRRPWLALGFSRRGASSVTWRPYCVPDDPSRLEKSFHQGVVPHRIPMLPVMVLEAFLQEFDHFRDSIRSNFLWDEVGWDHYFGRGVAAVRFGVHNMLDFGCWTSDVYRFCGPVDVD